ncbi:MAG: flagellar biosynthetic protein FliQ [Candidatus Zixiibacteriota bacterium]
MTPEFAVSIARNTLWTLFTIASPLVLGALLVGFLVGMFQSLTQVREVTLSFVPKIIAIGLLLWIMSPYLVKHLVEYSQSVFLLIEEAGL